MEHSTWISLFGFLFSYAWKLEDFFLSFFIFSLRVVRIQTRSCCSRRPLTGLCCVFVFSCVGRTTKDDPMSLNENNFLFVIYQNVHTTTQHWPDSERKDEIWREKIFFLSWRSVSCCQSFLLCCLHRRREIALISSMKSAEKKLFWRQTKAMSVSEWEKRERRILISNSQRSASYHNSVAPLIVTTTRRSGRLSPTTTTTDDSFLSERDWWQVHAADDDDNSNDFLDLQIYSVYFSPSISAVQCNSFNFFWR